MREIGMCHFSYGDVTLLNTLILIVTFDLTHSLIPLKEKNNSYVYDKLNFFSETAVEALVKRK